VCRECLESEYERVVHPKPWWDRLRPRLRRQNLIGFCILFGFSFALWRFDFPAFRVDHMHSTETAAELSALLACVAFFLDVKDKSRSANVAPKRFAGGFDWGRFARLAAIELIAGVLLYALFTVTPMFVPVMCGLGAWIIVNNEIFDPSRKKSLGSRLRGITMVPFMFCFIAWRITDRDLWLRLMLVGSTLMAGLLYLDRREDWE